MAAPRPADVASPLDQVRNVKLRLPMHHLVRLQSYRLLKHTTISHVLQDALEHYFATTARDALEGARPRAAADHEAAEPSGSGSTR